MWAKWLRYVYTSTHALDCALPLYTGPLALSLLSHAPEAGWHSAASCMLSHTLSHMSPLEALYISLSSANRKW